MQIKIFTIPIASDSVQVEELNHFLRANKIIEIKKELAMSGGIAYWTFCVTYMLSQPKLQTEVNQSQRGAKVDYKNVLTEVEFARFVDLRQLRKQIATEDAVPAYAVFTDAELAEIAKLGEITEADMRKIPGIGEKKVEKYGTRFVEMKFVGDNETRGILD